VASGGWPGITCGGLRRVRGNPRTVGNGRPRVRRPNGRSARERRNVKLGAMVRDFPYDAKRQIESLVTTLAELTKRDPEQEVQGIAIPVLDAVIEMVRGVMPDNTIVAAARAIISPEQIASGEPVRAADALLVARQLDAAIGDMPFGIA